VLTQLGYSAGQLVSFQVGSQPPTTLGYEGDKVRFIRHSAGNYEVFCYRTGTPGEDCVGGTLTDTLRWKARAGTEEGSDWTEKGVYAWWPGGTLKEERYLSRQGERVETRRVLRYAADAHQRPTWQAWGEGAGAFVATRSFDGADNLTGAGHAYNAPPAWCDVEPVSGRPRSPLCTALGYDRANRLVSLDEFPAPDAAAQRTLLEYDTHGNVRGVKTGCSSVDTFATCTQPASWYTFDDFGQVLEAQLPWAEGPVRYGYNAQGHPVVKETETMRRAGERLTYTYDALSRLVSTRWEYSRPVAGSQGLYRFQYDTSSEPPGPGCPLPARTLGRLLYREDSFGRTWYQYDEAGSVVGEIRERQGGTGCNSTAYHSPHTFYTYTPTGQAASLLYPYGRRVDYVYGTGADADRVVAVDVALREAGSWVTKRLLSNIVWEPYGGLRGYTLHHLESGTTSTVEYGLGSNGQVVPSGCGPLFPSSNPVEDPSDLTGRLRSLRVSSGTVPPGTGRGDLYQRNYTWQADQVVRTDTCLLGSTTPQTETFTYDAVLRLTQATGGLSTTGSAFGSRVYGYSPQGHRTSEQGDSLGWSHTYASASRPDWLSRRAATQGLLGYDYTADADGRALRKRWPPLSTGAPAATLDFTPGPSAGGAAETVFQSLRVNGALYEYRYDAWQRRWLKQYPGGVKDEFFYNLGPALLVDQGHASSTPSSSHPVDEYVWLAGRPVVMLRGRLDANWEHLPDSTQDCARSGEPARCGVYFPITDHLGKPVLMLDSQRRIAGVGEYDPFGHVNRVSVQGETPHPYHSFSGRFGPVLRQPVVAGTVLQQRVLVDALELYGDWMDCTSGSNDHSDAVYLRDVGTQAALTARYTASSTSGNFWTEWFTPGAAGAEAVLENIGSCSQQAECNDLYCQPGACVCGVSRPKSQVGAVLSAYEYRRFQPGASPLWTPLRFPGQYHDAESNLVHNWHRTYDPATGRYLQPEPLAAMGTRMATGKPYAYASHNPLRFQDPTGLYDTTELGTCPNWAPALAIARRRAGCGPEGSGKSDSSCSCQKKLAACSVCDICKIIDPGVGPLALQMDWRDEPSRGGRMGLICEPWDLKCPESRITKWRAFFATELCADPKYINDLAGTIIHEATHSCMMFGGKKVPDIGSEQCTAYTIEEACK
jgi:RHS repeat-associated protein